MFDRIKGSNSSLNTEDHIGFLITTNWRHLATLALSRHTLDLRENWFKQASEDIETGLAVADDLTQEWKYKRIHQPFYGLMISLKIQKRETGIDGGDSQGA
jgi:hypothetical protein